MDMVYARYIQSEFIKRKTKEALERTKKECDNKLFNVWLLTEQTRQEVVELEEELIRAKTVSNIQDTVNCLAPILGLDFEGDNGELKDEVSNNPEDKSLFNQICTTQEILEDICRGLEDVGHNIQVEGIHVDADKRVEAAEQIEKLIGEFNREVGGGSAPRLINQQMLNNMAGIDKFCRESENIAALSQEYSEIVESLDSLALQESSLKMSLQHLNNWEEKEASKNTSQLQCETNWI